MGTPMEYLGFTIITRNHHSDYDYRLKYWHYDLNRLNPCQQLPAGEWPVIHPDPSGMVTQAALLCSSDSA